MTSDELRRLVKERSVEFTEKPTQSGTRFDCRGGETFNVFRTGKISFQRKQDTPLASEVRRLYEGGSAIATGQQSAEAPQSVPAAGGPAVRPVFIVYGHDLAARDQLQELILHRMGLEPIILGNLAAAGDTIIEKLERYLGDHGNVGFACVLLTPDDEGYKAGKPEKRNTALDRTLSWSLGWSSPDLAAGAQPFLHKQSIEPPSDIAGLLYIPFTDRAEEVKDRLFTELREAGYNPDAAALN